MSLNDEDIKSINSAVKTSIKEAVKRELGDYKVPKEEHYKHHQFLSRLMKFQDRVEGSAIKAIVGLIVLALGTLIVYGFIFFGKSH